MDYHAAFAISAAGMDVERARVDVATLNLANAQTLLAPDGSGYRPQRVVVQAGYGAFEPWLDLARPVASIVASTEAPHRTLDPGHPWADAAGFISHPGVDTTFEMVTLMAATRAYEANVVAMNAARSMALKALDIGGNS